MGPQTVFNVKGRPNLKRRKRDADEDEDAEKAVASNHSRREMMPLPPPLRKGSGDIDRNKVRTQHHHVVRGNHQHHQRGPIKKQRRHSEHDMTKRTLDSREAIQ